MDTRSGKIISPEEANELLLQNREQFQKHFISVEKDEMTETQKKTLQVSKHDNKSKLGRKFLAARYRRNYFFNRPNN